MKRVYLSSVLLLCCFIIKANTFTLKEYKNLHVEQFNKPMNAALESFYKKKYERGDHLSKYSKAIFSTSRSGQMKEHLHILFEVPGTLYEVGKGNHQEEYEIGIYKTRSADAAFIAFIELVNDYLYAKRQEYIGSIRFMGKVLGVADANKVYHLEYNNEFGAIKDFEYLNRTDYLDQFEKMNIPKNTSITNLQLAFLRAYNVRDLINNHLEHFSTVVREPLGIEAKDEKDGTGYSYRKAVLELRLENFYLDEFMQLTDEVREKIIGFSEPVVVIPKSPFSSNKGAVQNIQNSSPKKSFSPSVNAIPSIGDQIEAPLTQKALRKSKRAENKLKRKEKGNNPIKAKDVSKAGFFLFKIIKIIFGTVDKDDERSNRQKNRGND